jgi:hypothetical protein
MQRAVSSVMTDKRQKYATMIARRQAVAMEISTQPLVNSVTMGTLMTAMDVQPLVQ